MASREGAILDKLTNPSSVSLGTGATLYRLGRLRVLHFNSSTGPYSDVPEGDRPDYIVRGTGVRRIYNASGYCDAEIAMTKVEISGQIVRYRYATYSDASTPVIVMTSSEEITGYLIWFV